MTIIQVFKGYFGGGLLLLGLTSLAAETNKDKDVPCWNYEAYRSSFMFKSEGTSQWQLGKVIEMMNPPRKTSGDTAVDVWNLVTFQGNTFDEKKTDPYSFMNPRCRYLVGKQALEEEKYKLAELKRTCAKEGPTPSFCDESERVRISKLLDRLNYTVSAAEAHSQDPVPNGKIDENGFYVFGCKRLATGDDTVWCREKPSSPASEMAERQGKTAPPDSRLSKNYAHTRSSIIAKLDTKEERCKGFGQGMKKDSYLVPSEPEVCRPDDPVEETLEACDPASKVVARSLPSFCTLECVDDYRRLYGGKYTADGKIDSTGYGEEMKDGFASGFLTLGISDLGMTTDSKTIDRSKRDASTGLSVGQVKDLLTRMKVTMLGYLRANINDKSTIENLDCNVEVPDFQSLEKGGSGHHGDQAASQSASQSTNVVTAYQEICSLAPDFENLQAFAPYLTPEFMEAYFKAHSSQNNQTHNLAKEAAQMCMLQDTVDNLRGTKDLWKSMGAGLSIGLAMGGTSALVVARTGVVAASSTARFIGAGFQIFGNGAQITGEVFHERDRLKVQCAQDKTLVGAYGQGTESEPTSCTEHDAVDRSIGTRIALGVTIGAVFEVLGPLANSKYTRSFASELATKLEQRGQQSAEEVIGQFVKEVSARNPTTGKIGLTLDSSKSGLEIFKKELKNLSPAKMAEIEKVLSDELAKAGVGNTLEARRTALALIKNLAPPDSAGAASIARMESSITRRTFAQRASDSLESVYGTTATKNPMIIRDAEKGAEFILFRRPSDGLLVKLDMNRSMVLDPTVHGAPASAASGMESGVLIATRTETKWGRSQSVGVIQKADGTFTDVSGKDLLKWRPANEGTEVAVALRNNPEAKRVYQLVEAEANKLKTDPLVLEGARLGGSDIAKEVDEFGPALAYTVYEQSMSRRLSDLKVDPKVATYLKSKTAESLDGFIRLMDEDLKDAPAEVQTALRAAQRDTLAEVKREFDPKNFTECKI